jgi:hypothetical protein
MALDYKELILDQFRKHTNGKKGSCLQFQKITFPIQEMAGYSAADCKAALGKLVKNGILTEKGTGTYCLGMDLP